MRPCRRRGTDGGFGPAPGSVGTPTPGVPSGSCHGDRCFTNETNGGSAVPPGAPAPVGDPQCVQKASPSVGLLQVGQALALTASCG